MYNRDYIEIYVDLSRSYLQDLYDEIIAAGLQPDIVTFRWLFFSLGRHETLNQMQQWKATNMQEDGGVSTTPSIASPPSEVQEEEEESLSLVYVLEQVKKKYKALHPTEFQSISSAYFNLSSQYLAPSELKDQFEAEKLLKLYKEAK